MQLPWLKSPNEKASIWSVIKECVGKDLSKFAVPVHFNEPISMLQKTCEAMEYQDIIHKANNCKDPVLRLIYIGIFNMAQYRCSEGRLTKPYNPILGETYEMKTKDFSLISEQVSHHPPISAAYAKSTSGDYEVWMNTNMKSVFWGASLEVQPLGLTHITLKNYPNEIFTACRPKTAVKNVIIG